MSITTNQDYKNAFTRKKENSIKRGIQFLLTEQEYTAIMKARSSLVCGYTNQKFVMDKGPSHKSYPEMDRIDPNKPYEKSNIIFCLSKVHKIKTDYVENNKSRKGMSHGNVCVLRSIEKLLSMWEYMERRLAPYYEIYNKVAERQQELADKDLRGQQKLREAAERVIKLEQVKAQEEEQNAAMALEVKIKAKFDKQLEIAEHYTQTYKMFSDINTTYQLTIKEHRDMIRRNSCALSGEKFNTTSEKYMWVVDKSLPLTKDNLKVCLKKYADCIDFLAKGDNIRLKTVMLSTLKFI